MSDRRRDWPRRRPLGGRGPLVTGLGLGGAPIGNLFTGVSDEQARSAVDAAWDAGIRYFDTAPLYGHGLSEQRLGRALAGRPRDDYVLSTKVGYALRPPAAEPAPSVFADVDALETYFDYSRDAVLRSFEASLDRLCVDRIDVVLVHDPDDHEHEALEQAFPTLVTLRDEGVIAAVGCGMNQSAMLERFVERVDLDCVLLAGRYSLLDRSGGAALLPACATRGIGVILGGVFNSGILVDPEGSPTYDYEDAPVALIARAQALKALCEAHGTTLPAAALQFAMRHPAVTAVLVGARSAGELVADVDAASMAIDETLWGEIEALGPG
ncbi:MAG: aldo/keto reductase [Acidimicrobiales bacterium]|jgi:D-threo-aldose 1-dehydrogenase